MKVPEGVDSAAVRQELLGRDDVCRIGRIGPNAAPGPVALVLGALKDMLDR